MQRLPWSRPVSLSVYLVDGAPTRTYAGAQKGILQDLSDPLQKAMATANKRLPSPLHLSYQTLNYTAQWFPSPTHPWDTNSDPAVRVYKPPMPVPDVIIATSEFFPDYLALLALDLAPYLDAVPADIPHVVLRQGRAYANGRETFQAALPLLRIPLLSVVQPGISAVRNGKAWTTAEFEATLRTLAKVYPSPDAPLPWLPYGMGLPEMAAVGSGGVLVQGTGPTGTAAQATFADGRVAEAMVEIIDWARFAPTATAIWRQWPTSGFHCGALLFDGAAVLAGHGPINARADAPFAIPSGWTVAPVPVFPDRPAVPVRTV